MFVYCTSLVEEKEAAKVCNDHPSNFLQSLIVYVVVMNCTSTFSAQVSLLNYASNFPVVGQISLSFLLLKTTSAQENCAGKPSAKFWFSYLMLTKRW